MRDGKFHDFGAMERLDAALVDAIIDHYIDCEVHGEDRNHSYGSHCP